MPWVPPCFCCRSSPSDAVWLFSWQGCSAALELGLWGLLESGSWVQPPRHQMGWEQLTWHGGFVSLLPSFLPSCSSQGCSAGAAPLTQVGSKSPFPNSPFPIALLCQPLLVLEEHKNSSAALKNDPNLQVTKCSCQPGHKAAGLDHFHGFMAHLDGHFNGPQVDLQEPGS